MPLRRGSSFDPPPELKAELDRIGWVPSPRVTQRALWVFAYGSLMWSPGFAVAERAVATLAGWHRSFCIRSSIYRGTPSRPGLALGLERGGSCRGVALRIPRRRLDATLRELWRREMPTRAYHARALPVRLADGRNVRALVFIANANNPQYDDLSEAELLHRVATGVGVAGHNRDYLLRTIDSLQLLRVHDGRMHRLRRRLPRAHPEPR